MLNLIYFLWLWHQFVPGLDLKRFVLFSKTWSTLASGQTASTIGLFHSRKCLTGDFLSLEIFFWFPLLIALSGLMLVNEHNRRRDASYFWDRCWIFSALVPVSNSFNSLSFLFRAVGARESFYNQYLTHYFRIVHCWYNINSNFLGKHLQGYSIYHTPVLLMFLYIYCLEVAQTMFFSHYRAEVCKSVVEGYYIVNSR